jgi:uncharacterized coiled-coil protein SlyX
VFIQGALWYYRAVNVVCCAGAALDTYNQHIAELKQQMAETTESSERIRRDLRSLSDRCGMMRFRERLLQQDPDIAVHHFAAALI